MKQSSTRFPMVTLIPLPGYTSSKPQSFLATKGTMDDICYDWGGGSNSSNGTIDYKYLVNFLLLVCDIFVYKLKKGLASTANPFRRPTW